MTCVIRPANPRFFDWLLLSHLAILLRTRWVCSWELGECRTTNQSTSASIDTLTYRIHIARLCSIKFDYWFNSNPPSINYNTSLFIKLDDFEVLTIAWIDIHNRTSLSFYQHVYRQWSGHSAGHPSSSFANGMWPECWFRWRKKSGKIKDKMNLTGKFRVKLAQTL